MKKSAIFLFLYLLAYNLPLTTYYCYAQTWQWGVRGGSIENATGQGPNENVVDICTDKWGNVYVLANTYKAGLDIDGHIKTGWGYTDVCVASFKCDGTYRWSKIIGAGNTDQAVAIKTDTLGGVYVTGSIYCDPAGPGGSGNFDSDTSIGRITKSIFIVKYDTAGVYKWLRMPQADTVTSGAVVDTRVLDMDVDDAGNIVWLVELPPGSFVGGSYIVSTLGLYILHYNNSGSFQSGTHPPVSYTQNGWGGMFMKMDWKNNRYYLAGSYDGTYGSLSIGSTNITYPSYIAAINGNGSVLWTRLNASVVYGGIKSRPTLDEDGNIYVTGQTGPGDSFNGVSFTNTLGIHQCPFIAKLDTNGNNKWALNGSTNAASYGGGAWACHDTVGFIGYYPGELILGSNNISSPPNTGYNIFFARLDATTGNVLALDTLLSTPGVGNDEFAGPLTADRNGSFYGGGSLHNDLFVNGDTLHNAGGETDWFVVKFGTANCGVPNAVRNILANNNEVQIYPNPITGTLFIKNAAIGTSYNIYNMLGQILLSGTINNNTEIVNTEDLKLGTYILQLTDKNGYRTTKTIAKQ
jgi:hypothetical protein